MNVRNCYSVFAKKKKVDIHDKNGWFVNERIDFSHVEVNIIKNTNVQTRSSKKS